MQRHILSSIKYKYYCKINLNRVILIMLSGFILQQRPADSSFFYLCIWCLQQRNLKHAECFQWNHTTADLCDFSLSITQLNKLFFPVCCSQRRSWRSSERRQMLRPWSRNWRKRNQKVSISNRKWMKFSDPGMSGDALPQYGSFTQLHFLH